MGSHIGHVSSHQSCLERVHRCSLHHRVQDSTGRELKKSSESDGYCMTSDCRPQLCSVHTHYTVLCPRGLGFWGLQSLWAFSQLRVNVRNRRVQRRLHERCKGSGSPDPHWARKVSSILLGMGTSLLLAS